MVLNDFPIIPFLPFASYQCFVFVFFVILKKLSHNLIIPHDTQQPFMSSINLCDSGEDTANLLKANLTIVKIFFDLSSIISAKELKLIK